MKKTVKVALCGLSFYSENKGCAALAYSFLELLNGIAKDQFDIELTIISNLPDDKTLKVTEYTSIKKIEYYEFHPYKIQTVFECIKALNRCDCIFDFTEGDSFTDIYGTKRLISVAFLKYLCIFSKACYILGPQTYGPFKSKKSKIIAACILKKADRVYARDQKSKACVENLVKRDVPTIIDVAFALPYSLRSPIRYNEKIRVGINVSGLLWNNGYTGKNELGLKTDYKTYCIKLAEYLQKEGKYQIYLIPHVICHQYNSTENDLRACDELCAAVPGCVVLKNLETPMEIKSSIAEMDVFIGARMHSTIAAFSSDTVVIPLSYSRKFEGLFGTIDYHYCVEGTALETEDAIKQTISYINRREELQKAVIRGNLLAKEKINFFSNELIKILGECSP